MSYEDKAAALGRMQQVMSSNEFDEFHFNKTQERVEELAMQFLTETGAGLGEGLTAKETATQSLKSLEAFLTLMESIPLPVNPVDSLVMEIVKTFVLDTTPLFHAFFADIMAETAHALDAEKATA